MKEKLYYIYIEGELSTLVYIIKKAIDSIKSEKITDKKKQDKIAKIKELTNSDLSTHKGKFTKEQKEEMKELIVRIKGDAFLRFVEVPVWAPYSIVKRDI